MKKRDLILIGIILLIALVGFGILNINQNNQQNKMLVISRNNEIIKTVPLTPTTNETFIISNDNEWNEVVITNGVVDVVDANCKNHICVDTKSASQQNDVIVCLPHKLVFEIKSVNNE